jgi:hypothetical protein
VYAMPAASLHLGITTEIDRPSNMAAPKLPAGLARRQAFVRAAHPAPEKSSEPVEREGASDARVDGTREVGRAARHVARQASLRLAPHVWFAARHVSLHGLRRRDLTVAALRARGVSRPTAGRSFRRAGGGT